MRRITDKTKLLAFRMSYIPQAHRLTAQKCASKKGDAVAWTWNDKDGRPCAVVFMGAAQNPWSGRDNSGTYYYFKIPEARRAFVARAFEVAASIAERRNKNRAEKAAAREAGHALKVGDVLRASWGYDQTNIDFYQVTKVIGTQTVEICEIGQQSEGNGFMSGVCVPDVGNFIGKPIRRRVSDYGKRDSVKVNSCAYAYKQECKEVAGMKIYGTSTWTAYA